MKCKGFCWLNNPFDTISTHEKLVFSFCQVPNPCPAMLPKTPLLPFSKLKKSKTPCKKSVFIHAMAVIHEESTGLFMTFLLFQKKKSAGFSRCNSTWQWCSLARVQSRSEKNGRIPERLELALDKKCFFLVVFTLEGSGSNWSYTCIEQQEIWTLDHKATGVCVCGVFGCIICMIFEVEDYQHIYISRSHYCLAWRKKLLVNTAANQLLNSSATRVSYVT